MSQDDSIGLPVDQELKQHYLGFYSEWVDIKYEIFGTVRRLPDKIWDFATGHESFKIVPDKFHKAEEVLHYQQREAVNVRTAWRLLCNGESNPYRYLESAYAWFLLLERYLERQGQKDVNDPFQAKHLNLRLNQDQHNILHEMELALDPAIIGLVAISERVAHVIVRTFNEIFPDHNSIYCYVDRSTDENKVLEYSQALDIKTGQVFKTLVKSNTDGRLSPLIGLLHFFVSDEFEALRNYRNDYVHGFGQKVGHPDQDLQMVYKYVDIQYKKDKQKEQKVFKSRFPFLGVSGQDWTHHELINLTLNVWNETVDVITQIFDALQEIYVEEE